MKFFRNNFNPHDPSPHNLRWRVHRSPKETAMGITATVLMICFVIGYIFIERIFVVPPKFMPFYILVSAIMVMTTV